MIKKILLLTVFIFQSIFLFSQTLEKALERSKKNRQNLENVLNHYKSRSEHKKYEATVFLIENMPIHKSVDYQWLDQEKNIIKFSEFDFPDFNTAYAHLKELKDSIGIRPRKTIQYDLTTISSQLLIKNIDLAFLEWKNNLWSKNYSFETFCEYILPHRNLIEPLEDWREDIKHLVNLPKFKIEDKADPTEICTQIINGLDDFTFINKRPDPIPILSPSQMLYRRQGSCPDLANFAVLACRSVGVAATFDFTPHYAASSNRHFWNTVVDKDGNHIPFNSNAVNDCNDCLPYQYNANRKRLGKVFRTTYSIQKQSLANLIPASKIPEEFLKQKNIKDVTSEYVSVSDLIIDSSRLSDSIAYINVFNLGKWKVVDWGQQNKTKIIFKNLGRDLIYLVSTYNGKTHNYLKHPFLIDKKGNLIELIPDYSNASSINLTRHNEYKTDSIDFNTLEIIQGEKYDLNYWDNGWKKVGTSIATSKGLFFKNVPSNTLFRLLPEKPDRFERIFIIEPNTNKIFWH